MRWIIDQAQKENVKVDQDAAHELIDALGADMMLVSHQLEKLILYVAEKTHHAGRRGNDGARRKAALLV